VKRKIICRDSERAMLDALEGLIVGAGCAMVAIIFGASFWGGLVIWIAVGGGVFVCGGSHNRALRKRH